MERVKIKVSSASSTLLQAEENNQVFQTSTDPLDLFLIEMKERYPNAEIYYEDEDNVIPYHIPDEEAEPIKEKEAEEVKEEETPEPMKMFNRLHKNSIHHIKKCPKGIKGYIKSRQGYYGYLAVTGARVTTSIATGLFFGKSTLGVIGIAIGTDIALNILSVPLQLKLYESIDNKYLKL